MSTADIYNSIQVNDMLITGGQPTAEQLEAAADEGVVTVINLATYSPGHSLEDEAGIVRSHGMAYYAIPVDWGNPKESDFAAFEDLMQKLPPGKTLIHCAANYRVTAFYSLYAQKHLGWSDAQAEQFRMQIWSDSNVPVWEELIARIKAQLSKK